MSPGAALGAMTLVQLIDSLRNIHITSPVWVGSGRYRPDRFSSYRGFYEDLAIIFEVGAPRPAGDLAIHCEEGVLNHSFNGYKGGSYRATRDTAV